MNVKFSKSMTPDATSRPTTKPEAPRQKAGSAAGLNPVQLAVFQRLDPGSRVLQIGLTTEVLARELHDQGCRLITIERDRGAAMRMKPYCERVVVSSLSWPQLASEIPQGQYDAVVALGLLEGTVDPLPVLRYLKDRLLPTGHFIAVCPNFAHVTVRLALFQKGVLPPENASPVSVSHVNHYTRQSLEALLEQAGYLVGALERIELPLQSSPGIPADVDHALEQYLKNDSDASTSHFVVVAYPAELPHLQMVQERIRGLAEAHEAAQRELASLRPLKQRLERQEKGIAVLRELVQQKASELGKLRKLRIAESELRTAKSELHTADSKLCSMEEGYESLASQLREIMASPGWRFISSYRRWLERHVWTRPWLKKVFEKAASLLLPRAHRPTTATSAKAGRHSRESAGHPAER